MFIYPGAVPPRPSESACAGSIVTLIQRLSLPKEWGIPPLGGQDRIRPVVRASALPPC